MIQSASNSTTFNAGVVKQSLSARDAYLAKLNQNNAIVQSQNNKVQGMYTQVSMQGAGQKLNVIA